MKWLSPAALALLTVPVVGLFACICLMHLDALILQAAKHEAALSESVQAAVDEVNGPCGEKNHVRRCGTLAEAQETFRRTTDLLTQIQEAARHADQVSQSEAKILPELNSRTLRTFDLIDSAISTTSSDTQDTQKQLRSSLATLETTLSSSATTLNTTTDTIHDIDKAINGEELKRLMHNMDAMSFQMAGIATDVHDETNKIVHPAKKVGFWAGVMTAAGIVHQFEPPIF